MRFLDQGNGFSLWLSANDTYNWANKRNAWWPCSFLSGKRLVVQFDRNGLLDLTINGGKGDQDCPADELSAIVVSFVKNKINQDHPCHFVAVGQFEG